MVSVIGDACCTLTVRLSRSFTSLQSTTPVFPGGHSGVYLCRPHGVIKPLLCPFLRPSDGAGRGGGHRRRLSASRPCAGTSGGHRRRGPAAGPGRPPRGGSRVPARPTGLPPRPDCALPQGSPECSPSSPRSLSLKQTPFRLQRPCRTLGDGAAAGQPPRGGCTVRSAGAGAGPGPGRLAVRPPRPETRPAAAALAPGDLGAASRGFAAWETGRPEEPAARRGAGAHCRRCWAGVATRRGRCLRPRPFGRGLAGWTSTALSRFWLRVRSFHC